MVQVSLILLFEALNLNSVTSMHVHQCNYRTFNISSFKFTTSVHSSIHYVLSSSTTLYMDSVSYFIISESCVETLKIEQIKFLSFICEEKYLNVYKVM